MHDLAGLRGVIQNLRGVDSQKILLKFAELALQADLHYLPHLEKVPLAGSAGSSSSRYYI